MVASGLRIAGHRETIQEEAHDSARRDFPDWLRELNRVVGSNQRQIAAFAPPADLIEDEDGVTVYMDVPGVSRDDLEIEIQNDLLTVRHAPVPVPVSGRRRHTASRRARLRPLRAEHPRPAGAHARRDPGVAQGRGPGAPDPEA
jgi:HSP20 family molecular chaperone IbpA